MTPKKKSTSVKIKSLEGRFFDIKPTKGGTQPPVSRTRREFFRFFCIAFIVFLGLSFSSIYMEGKDLTASSEKYAMAGYDSLQNAVQSLVDQDMNNASIWFHNAEVSFEELARSTRYLTSQANHLINESLYLNTANKLVESGIMVSQMGQELIELMEGVRKLPQTFIMQQEEDGSDLISLINEEKAKFDNIFHDILIVPGALAN